MAKSFAAFARECRQFSETVDDAAGRGVNAAALHVTTGVRRSLNRVVPDGRLSGTKRNAKLSVRYKAARKGDTSPSALISANGPWPLVESDTPKHTIPKRRSARSKRQRKVLNIPGVGFRRYVEHPGTKGQHPFRNGVRATQRDVPQIVTREIRQQMRKTFG